MTNASAVPAAAPAQAVSPRGRFFADQEFHYETLRNAGYIASNCADLSEVLETVKVITEGDVQSWYTGWKATADRVLALAEHMQDTLSKAGPTCALARTSARLSFCSRPTIPSVRNRSSRQCSMEFNRRPRNLPRARNVFSPAHSIGR